ncbi:hypothetical protein DB459_09365 [Bradyrhizobium sp. WD16]|nr:hypothetical protein DB459_09365 [Bradyrhizobium sp. WD16]
MAATSQVAAARDAPECGGHGHQPLFGADLSWPVAGGGGAALVFETVPSGHAMRRPLRHQHRNAEGHQSADSCG